MRTARYRVVLPKIDRRRLIEGEIDCRRSIEEEKREEEEEEKKKKKKKKRIKKYLLSLCHPRPRGVASCGSPARRRR
ncbi:hypothetical protein B296_00012424, partial [Ensete ventricosum]